MDIHHIISEEIIIIILHYIWISRIKLVKSQTYLATDIQDSIWEYKNLKK